MQLADSRVPSWSIPDRGGSWCHQAALDQILAAHKPINPVSTPTLRMTRCPGGYASDASNERAQNRPDAFRSTPTGEATTQKAAAATEP
jgi:hypothetical protein